ERKGAGYATFHLRHDLADNYALQASKVLRRFLRGDIAGTILPPLALLLAVASLLLVRLRRAAWIVPLVLATAAPLALHFVAWDTARFSTFTLFHAFVALLAVVLFHGDRLGDGVSGRWGRCVGWGLAACALPVVAANVLLEVPGFSPERVTDEAILRWRTGPTVHSFEDCRPVFENAGFELGNQEGWTATGEAFAETPERAVRPRATLPHPGVLGGWWVTSDVRNRTGDEPPMRHRARGTLESVPFRIEGDDILLAVGGGRNLARLYVALEVEGEEVYRETGSGSSILEPRVWDVRAHRSRDAVIRIVDASERRTGFIHADGFCYFR
ncbi:MAG: hypothetical protein JXB39_15425, partial [Deltaproteobacteria bacterium]|nr:hypothetical protein [Deltaproteobacteria bacterium]